MREKHVLLAAVAATLTALAACDGAVVTNARHTAGEERRYEVRERVDRVVVRAHAGSVRVRGGADDRAAVTEELHYDERKPRTEHRLDGDTLVLRAACPPVRQDRCWVDYTVAVDRRAEVVVETGAGNVDVEGIARPVRATTGAGNVRGMDLSGGQVSARTDAGEVMLGLATPPETVDAVTSAGDVTVRLPGRARYAVDAVTDVGDRSVGVATDPGSPHRIRAHSETGDVTVVGR